MEYYTTIIIPILLLLIGLVGLVANGLVTWAIMSNKQARIATINILVINLTVVDILFIITYLPFDVIYSATSTWLFGELWCKMCNYFFYVFIYMNVYTVVLMSLDRFLAIMYPAAYKSMRTVRNTSITVFGLWLLVFSCCIPFIPILHLYHISERYVHCAFLTDYRNEDYVISHFIASIVLPMSIIATLYVLMIKKQYSKSADAETEKHVSAQVAIFAIIFFVSWAPLQILTVYTTFSANHNYSQSFHIAHMILFVFSRAFVCFYPILFFVMCKVFPKYFPHVSYCNCLTQKSEGTIHSEMIPINMATENHDSHAE